MTCIVSRGDCRCQISLATWLEVPSRALLPAVSACRDHQHFAAMPTQLTHKEQMTAEAPARACGAPTEAATHINKKQFDRFAVLVQFSVLQCCCFAVLQFRSFEVLHSCSFAVLQFCNFAAWQFGSLAGWQFGSLSAWQLGSLTVWQFDSLAVWQFGSLAV